MDQNAGKTMAGGTGEEGLLHLMDRGHFGPCYSYLKRKSRYRKDQKDQGRGNKG